MDVIMIYFSKVMTINILMDTTTSFSAKPESCLFMGHFMTYFIRLFFIVHIIMILTIFILLISIKLLLGWSWVLVFNVRFVGSIFCHFWLISTAIYRHSCDFLPLFFLRFLFLIKESQTFSWNFLLNFYIGGLTLRIFHTCIGCFFSDIDHIFLVNLIFFIQSHFDNCQLLPIQPCTKVITNQLHYGFEIFQIIFCCYIASNKKLTYNWAVFTLFYIDLYTVESTIVRICIGGAEKIFIFAGWWWVRVFVAFWRVVIFLFLWVSISVTNLVDLFSMIMVTFKEHLGEICIVLHHIFWNIFPNC